MLTSPRAVREISRSSLLAEQGRLTTLPTRPLEKSGVGPLTARQTWRPWTSFRLGRVFSSLGVYMRRNSRIAARIAGPAIILCGLPGFASAQNAIWNGPGADWNTPANWLTTVPGPNGTALFTGTFPKEISMAGVVEVGTLQFSAPRYIFDVDAGAVRINGFGVDDLGIATNAPTFNVVSTVGATLRSTSITAARPALPKSFLAK